MSWKSFLLGGSGTTDPNKAKFGDGDYIRDVVHQGVGLGNRDAPQATGVQVNQDFRDRNLGLVNRLTGIASGQQMGAGELAARRQGQQAYANAIGAATMNRGAGAVNGARMAARAAAGIGQQTSGMSQQAALNDQQAANGMLGQQINAGQSGDLSAAGLDQQTRLANMQSKLSTMGLNDNAQLGFLGQLGQMNQSELAARMAQEQADAQNKGVLGGLMSMAGGLGSAYLANRK